MVTTMEQATSIPTVSTIPTITALTTELRVTKFQPSELLTLLEFSDRSNTG